MITADTDPLAPFSERWAIAARPAGLPVWTAEQVSEDGRHIRYIVAPTAAELAGKLQAAELEEP
jgi:hypothetical protein